VPLPRELDPAATAFASRLASDRWFCWEQPDRGVAIAALGSAVEVISRGEHRFAEVAASCAEAARGLRFDALESPPAGAGPIWTGGFAFAPDGGRSPSWSSFPPALMVLPEVSIARSGGACWLTLNVAVDGGDGAERARARASARLAGLAQAASLPLLDPHRIGRTQIRSARTPGEFEAAVVEASRRIAEGEIAKTVLAREVVLEAPGAYDPAAIFGALR
jgi:menaquinone-specific isochorismate synthase